jgi:segregation and condensation protein B
MPDLSSVIEALIFVAEAPVSIDRLCTLLEEHGRAEIREAVSRVAEEYERRGSALCLAEVAGGYQFRTRPEYADFLRRTSKSKPFRFSQSALETLAIVAYRQPVTRSEIEYLRGVDCGGVLKTLLEKRLLRILGRKDIPGKPIIYGTSREFLELFGLKDLASLPTLKEVQQLSETPSFEEQQELPLPAAEQEGEGSGEGEGAV